MENSPPTIVIIVPYRDRAPQKKVFEAIIPQLFEDYNYQLFFIHQADPRPFNRGAMKNIGFLVVKKLYPEKYKNITLVFHDIDIMAFEKDQFNYETRVGTVKHFFGYKNTLGGIVSMKACDFERVNGFPNVWTWGLEDNILQKRCLTKKIRIDRSTFFQGGRDEKHMVILWHGWDRLINPTIKPKFYATSDIDGVGILKSVDYTFELQKDRMRMVNVSNFKTGEKVELAVQNASIMNSRKNATFKNPGRRTQIRNRHSFLSMNFYK